MQRCVLVLATAACLDFGLTYSTAAADMPVKGAPLEAPLGILSRPRSSAASNSAIIGRAVAFWWGSRETLMGRSLTGRPLC
jgi:hypothetical protein